MAIDGGSPKPVSSKYIADVSHRSSPYYPGLGYFPGSIPGAYQLTTTRIDTNLVVDPVAPLLRLKLSPHQLAYLLASHAFISMVGTDFCLFCYALDQYRTSVDHLFVIHEE